MLARRHLHSSMRWAIPINTNDRNRDEGCRALPVPKLALVSLAKTFYRAIVQDGTRMRASSSNADHGARCGHPLQDE